VTVLPSRGMTTDAWDQAARELLRQDPVIGVDAWLATGRRDAATLAQIIPPDPSGCLLEVGCGPGRVTRALAEAWGMVVAVDSSWSMARPLAEASLPNVRVLVGDAADLTGLEVDAAYAFRTVGCMTRKEAYNVLGGVRRCLPEGARFALQLPLYQSALGQQTRTSENRWTLHMMKRMCASTGFGIVHAEVTEAMPRHGWEGEYHNALHELEAI
jgi:trans-aconitate methyltransferase